MLFWGFFFFKLIVLDAQVWDDKKGLGGTSNIDIKKYT